MTSDGLLIVRFLFQTIWRFFTTWYIPGTRTTPGMWFVFSIFFAYFIRFVKGPGAVMAGNDLGREIISSRRRDK